MAKSNLEPNRDDDHVRSSSENSASDSTEDSAENSTSDSKSDGFAPRLDQINTQWSLMRRAHAGDGDLNDADARNELVMRYSSAIRSYVRALTKSEDEADELSQDVIVRILKGDFAGADPNRGRFRDLLKIAVRNMVRNYWQKSNRRKSADVEVGDVEPGQTDPDNDPWMENWRSNLLDIAWSRLEQFQNEREKSVAYSILRLRAEHLGDSSTELAARLSQATGIKFKPATVRQQLRRARLRFSEFLVEEIADGMDGPTPESIQTELIALGLYEQVKDTLPDDWSRRVTE